MTNPTVELGRISIDAGPGEQLVSLTMYQPPVMKSLSTPPTESPSLAVDETIGQLPTQEIPSWWAPLERSKHSSRARAVALVDLPVPHQFDADLAQLLATETFNRQIAPDESLADRQAGDDQIKDEQFPTDLTVQVGPQLNSFHLPA
ncbi:MAG: hypothetical protein WD738_17320 [Pirellulales bacterium]